MYPTGTLEYIYPRANVYFVKTEGKETSDKRIAQCRSLALFKKMLMKGCGNQGWMKCENRHCNRLTMAIFDDCPGEPEKAQKYLFDELNDVLAQWYDLDHFIAIAKTNQFGHTQKLHDFLCEVLQ